MSFVTITRFLFLSIAIAPAALRSQTPTPFVTAEGRFVVFMNGRFEQLEAQPPKRIYPNGDRLAYLTSSDELKLYTDGKVVPLRKGDDAEIKTSNGLFAWKEGSTLRIANEAGPSIIAEDVGEWSLSDSLIAFHNTADRTLNVYWRGRSFPIADLGKATEAPQWQCGSNTLVFYDRSKLRATLFYRGRTEVLADSMDYSRIAPGGDIVAYFDENTSTFRVFDRGQRKELEAFMPITFRTGADVVGYVSNGGRLKAYEQGGTSTLANPAPAEYWVQDSVVLFVEKGMLKTVDHGKVDIIERYVPEQWSVHGSTVAYLDLNREPRLYRRGERVVVSHDADVKEWEHYAGAVTWRNQLGTSKVFWRGKVYEF